MYRITSVGGSISGVYFIWEGLGIREGSTCLTIKVKNLAGKWLCQLVEWDVWARLIFESYQLFNWMKCPLLKLKPVRSPCVVYLRANLAGIHCVQFRQLIPELALMTRGIFSWLYKMFVCYCISFFFWSSPLRAVVAKIITISAPLLVQTS